MLTSSDGSATPIFDSYSIGYTYGPTPLPNIPFSLQGTKTIGTGPSGNVYKYNSQNLNTGASASFSTTTLEWDSYTITIGSGSGYDVASSCPSPQPIALSPAASEVDNLYLAPHTTNSLLIDVRSNATDALVQNATVVLSRTGFTATSTTDACGQVFFGGLTSASDYTVQTSATGYVPNTQTNVTGSGTATLSITL
jgi:hypothetical protein